ncbi:MAG TPA: CPBP family intramembrane glutamic endopeptidase [Thermoanaerobaculia bacterium]|nr:CPBP family intramembrane glutamic endopeptidase [Thermoanaerobaculia bacterium]
MDLESLLRGVVPVLLALAAAGATDRLVMRREAPPGFAVPWRRAAAAALLAGLYYVAVFAALGLIGQTVEIDLATTRPWELFALHGQLVAVLLAWGALAYAGPDGALGPRLARAFGLAADRPRGAASPARESAAGGTPRPRRELHVGREILLGLAGGFAIWGAVVAVLMLVGLLVYAAGWDELLPKSPPQLVAFVAGQPWWLRLGIALSAGFVEETFFRGFLQRRIGLPLSTTLFVLAHANYGVPFMLVGVTLLSVVYGLLTRWRGNVWAAAVAHFVFDAVQLLVLVPWAMERIGSGAALLC